MAKIYSKKNEDVKCVSPKKETISFLLNYSKALRIVQHKNFQFENILN